MPAKLRNKRGRVFENKPSVLSARKWQVDPVKSKRYMANRDQARSIKSFGANGSEEMDENSAASTGMISTPYKSPWDSKLTIP